NHAGLMTKAQMDDFQKIMDVAEGEEWEPFATVSAPDDLKSALAEVPFFAKGPRRYSAPRVPSPGPVFLDDEMLSTQAGLGKILDALARGDSDLSQRILTTSPDVTVSTNLGGWVNR